MGRFYYWNLLLHASNRYSARGVCINGACIWIARLHTSTHEIADLVYRNMSRGGDIFTTMKHQPFARSNRIAR